MNLNRLAPFVVALLVPAGRARAAGESVNGFPSYPERLLHALTNRARVDPQAELANCGTNCPESACYMPTTPVYWNEKLNRAARFHSAHLTRGGYTTTIQHSSNCVIADDIATKYPTTCNGEAACSCKAAGTTTPQERVSRFGVGYGGEIIFSSSSPRSGFYAWLFEKSTDTACKYTTPNGHRWLLLTGGDGIGFGVDGRSTGDFGTAGERYKIPSGIHEPRSGPAVDFIVNWNDTAAPKSARVNVGGTCLPLTRERGSDENGAWTGKAEGLTGCTRYYFAFEDSTGASVTYPSSGSFGIGDATTCPEFDTARPSGCGSCTPNCAAKTCGADGCGGSCGSCATGASCAPTGTCVTSAVDAGVDGGAKDGGSIADTASVDAPSSGDAPGPGDAAAPDDAASDDAATPDNTAAEEPGAIEGSCGCRTARAADAPWSLGLVMGLALRRRRQRRVDG